MNEPAMPATSLTPSAMPRCLAGKTSVMMATELASSMRAADGLDHPPGDQPQRAVGSVERVQREQRSSVTVNTAKPGL